MSGVRVRGLVKSFRSVGRKPQRVLAGIDLDIAPGEVVGLIGPNGAGKTTLMSCLLGFLFADHGEITIDDKPNDDLGVRARTGFVPERMNFDRRATGRQFLMYMTRLAGVPAEEIRPRVGALMERLGVANAANKRLSQYSRGMLQRVVMAQALVHEPQFLFLDEPASGLDPNGIMLVREVIAEQRSRGAAVLLNSHQLAEVERVCDRVLFLTDGVIAQHEQLRGAANVRVAITLLAGSFDAGALQEAAGVAPADNVLHVTATTDDDVAELVRRVVRTGAGVVEVRRETADLEAIFRRSA